MFHDFYSGLFITIAFLVVLGAVCRYLYILNSKERKERREFDRLLIARLRLITLNEVAGYEENKFDVYLTMLKLISVHLAPHGQHVRLDANKYRYKKMAIAHMKDFYVLLNDLANKINRTTGIEYFDHRELGFLYR